MKKAWFIIIFMTFTTIGLSLVQVGLSNHIATDGATLVGLDQKIDDYKRQNIILNEQLLQASSLTNLANKAEKLGFVTSKTPIYLSTPLPVAMKQ